MLGCHIGMSYSQAKVHLWKTRSIYAPHGCECLYLEECDLIHLQTAQASLLKLSVGLGKRCHHSSILRALNVAIVKYSIGKEALSLYYCIYYCIFQVGTTCRDLCMQLLSMHLSSSNVFPGTLVDRTEQLGYSPILCAFQKCIPWKPQVNKSMVWYHP